MRTWTFPNGKTLAGQWHYLTVSFNNGTAQSWLDGTKIEYNWSNVQAPNESKTHQLVFAGGMTGYVDEMRMMDGATSDAWVAADYAAQTDADFLSYGGVVATWFAVKPIAKQVYVPGGAPCEPIPTIFDTATGAELDAKDFTFTWTDNTARGTGTVKVTAKGGSAGDQMSADFTIVNGYYVTGYALAKEGDGLSWESAMSLTNAIAVAAADDVLMLKAGVYPVAAQLTISKPLTLKGGYAGTDDVALAADPVSTLDGQGTAENVVNATAASSEQTFSRMAFVNGKKHGLNKTGAGAISVFNCRFANNGTQVSGLNGRGACLGGTAGTTVAVVSNCVFEGNAQCSYTAPDGSRSWGFAIYAENLASLTIDDTLFLTNGAGPSAESGYNSVARQGNFRGSAIYANAVPVTARRCQFRANRATCYGSAGGCVWLEGACGGSVFDHCLWAGNYENWGWGDGGVKASTHSGALVLNLSSVNDTVTVRSSTIAYNIAGLKDSAAGISVGKGKLNLVDSVLCGNRISGASNKGGVGRDLALTTGNGFADVSYTLFTSNDVTSVSSAVAGNLKLVAGVVYGDPLFVTGLEEAMSHVGSWDYRSACYKAADLAEVLAFDLHERTSAGYVTNGAPTEWQKAEKGVASPAIDAGDPDAAWTNEQDPNGSRLNAGFYGNTAEASKSVTSETPLGFADMTVRYPDGYSRPVIGFTATGDAGCVIDAKATVTVDGGDPFELSIPGCAVGKLQEIALSDYYARNASVVVAFSGRSSAGSVTPSEFDFTVDRDPAPWNGHGGGEGIIHVREGAMGARDGSSWTDAFDTIDDALALAAADATKTNVWIAGTLVSHKAVTDRSVKTAKLEIRGGFVGDEDSADERKQPYSTLSGEDLQDMVSINNAAGHDVVFERICFTRGLNRGLNKSGNGAIAIFDCRFLNNGTAVKGQSGRGVYLVGSAASTVAVISNCVFEGNAQCRYETPDSYGGKGFAIYAENFASLTVDDTLFVTNGAGPGSAMGWNTVGREGHFFGSAIYASASPVTARRCQFRANRATCHGSAGGCVWLEGACGGSVFDHCLWTGNYEAWGHGGTASASTKAGALVVNLANTDDTVTVRHSTIAYYIAELKNSAAGISVAKGKLLLSNSIVFGNRVLEASATLGADLALTTADGYADVAYTLFSTNDVSSVGAVAVDNCELGKGVVYDDPLLATGLAEALSHVNGWSGSSHNMYYKPADIGEVAAFNVHLRGRNGYLDEKTGKVVRFGGRTSPAIDAGEPESVYENEPHPNGRQVNLGFYGNTPWATMSKGGTMLLVR